MTIAAFALVLAGYFLGSGRYQVLIYPIELPSLASCQRVAEDLKATGDFTYKCILVNH